MEIISLKTHALNQNNYNKNVLTPENVGALLIYPVGYTPETCLSCDGYILKIIDYELLYSIIGKNFNSGTESTDEFRIPDYNISKRFLQPSQEPSKTYEAGLPNITGTLMGIDDNSWSYSGAFYSKALGGTSGGNLNGSWPGFDASRCSAIYGRSSTVQPPSQGVHICIRYK